MNRIKKKFYLCFTFILAVSMALLSGCSRKDGNDARLVVSINDTKVYLDEVMYNIWQMEQECSRMALYYSQNYNEDFWEQDLGEGDRKIMRDKIKEDVLEDVVRSHILYDKALEEGYRLTSQEKEECRLRAEEIIKECSEQLLSVTGFTDKVLAGVYERELLAGQYYKSVVDGFNLDQEEIAKGIDPKDYRQYDVETIRIPKQDEDQDRESDDNYSLIGQALAAARTKGSFEGLVEDDQSPLEYEEFSFIYGDGTCDEEIEQAAAAMVKGEISEVLEYGTSYVIVRLVDNSSSEGYEDAVESAVSNAEYKAFDEYYDSIKPQYTIIVNDQVWDTIIMGKTTIFD